MIDNIVSLLGDRAEYLPKHTSQNIPSREIIEISEAFAVAHDLGMATVLWCHLRNDRQEG